MLLGKYHFICSFKSDAVLPPYKGSTFRGVFGRALKKVVCALKRAECANCLLREKCVYALTFETSVIAPMPENSRLPSLPPPFVIEPPLNTDREFAKGTAFDFHLLLFGNMNSNLPYFIYAFEQMGKIGIGKKIEGQRAQFTLEEVKTGEHTIYNSNDRQITLSNSPETLSLNGPGKYPEDSFRLRVSLETPLRIKYHNRLKADLPFHVLVRAMLRRISSLCVCYGDGEPDLDYKGLVKRADDIGTDASKLGWYDWRRYSFRQDKSMLMGGITGYVDYEGKIGEFMPFIDFCQRAHIGKQTTFGLGKIKAELLE